MGTRLVTSRGWLVVVGCLGLLVASPAWAEEPPHLEFARGLREKGYHDLALEYLKSLESHKQLSAEVGNVLPLEIARTRSEMIAREESSAARDKLVEETRADLQAFVKDPKNANHPALPEARVELARVVLEQGRKLVRLAKAEKDKTKRANLVNQAIKACDEADKGLEEAAKKLDAQLTQMGDPKDKKGKDDKQRVLGAYLTAVLYQGVGLFEKADLLGDIKKAADAQAQAVKNFDKVVGFRDQHPLGWMGYAWVFRASMNQDNLKLESAYRALMAEKKAEITPAQRQLRYFQIVAEYTNYWQPDAGSKIIKKDPVEALVDSWLKDYPKDSNSYEGQHLRLLQGLMILEKINKIPKNQLQSTAASSLADQAVKVFDALANTPGEFARPATYFKKEVVRKTRKVADKKIDELHTFVECLTRAEYELEEISALSASLQEAKAKMERGEEPKEKAAAPIDNAKDTKEPAADDMSKEVEALAKELESHKHDFKQVTRKTVKLMPDNVKEDQWEQVYKYLYLTYRLENDYPRATVVIDYIASHAKKPDTAKTYYALALDLYSGLGYSYQDDVAKRRGLAIAEILEKRWPNAPETDTARTLIGRNLLRQQKIREAAETFEKVTPGSPTYASNSFSAGSCYWSLHLTAMREAKKPATEASPEREKALALLERSIKAYDEMKANADRKGMVRARLYLAGEVFNKLGDNEKMLAYLTPLIPLAEDKDALKDLDKGSDTKIMSLLLKVYVQKKDMENAKKVLESLQKLGGGDDSSGLAAQLYDIGKQIKTQIAALEKEGESVRSQLDDLKSGFKLFLDYLSDPMKNPNLSPELQIWIGSSYASIGDHKQAIKMFTAVKDPGPQGNAQLKATAYHQCLLFKTQSQRQAAAAGTDPTAKKQAFAQAEKDLEDLMKDPKDPKKRSWAGRSPAFLSEKILLLQDQELYSGSKGAITAWAGFMKDMEKVLDNDQIRNDATRLKMYQSYYYDACFNEVYCMFKEAKQIKDKATSQKAVQSVAQKVSLILKNDNLQAVHERLRQFMDEHKDLKKEFDALSGKKL